MNIDVKVPSVGESITEVSIATWLKSNGDYVKMDETICEIESEKATFELAADKAGTLSITTPEGDTVEIGAVIAKIDTGASPPADSGKKESESKSAPEKIEESGPAPTSSEVKGGLPSPAARKILDEKGISVSHVAGTGKDGRITKSDALSASAPSVSAPSTSSATSAAPSSSPAPRAVSGARAVTEKRMSALRKTIAKRLVAAKNLTAMLTTFNEVDMTAIMELRKKYKESFKKKYEVGLGFMSFFTKAVCQALQEYPAVNAQIKDDYLYYHEYVDVGVAVSTPKGLVVPVVRNAESLAMDEIERSIVDLATRARKSKLSIAEMEGGTFTITNGGVFGSLMSTPILNVPQSAILGMHKIQDRPMAIGGEVVIRPMMYLALSYDHRVVDGRESVGFLVRVKELLEDPGRMLIQI